MDTPNTTKWLASQQQEVRPMTPEEGRQAIEIMEQINRENAEKRDGSANASPSPAGSQDMAPKELAKLKRDFTKADAESKRWAERAGQASREGVTRARMTSINARWSQAAQRRDELKAMVKAAEVNQSGGEG